jgi:predicted dehydrogenase
MHLRAREAPLSSHSKQEAAYRVKVYGAGSVGNHLANAARRLGWNVVVGDVSEAALDRMREEIYPQRYGEWDAEIEQFTNEQAPRGGFDLIIIGTPPDSHIPLAHHALEEEPRALLVEKPLCSPSLEGADAFAEAVDRSGTTVFVGYNHVVGAAATRVEELVNAGAVGPLKTLEVDFREHWGGIFAAHPWLSGPSETYLGDWTRGGGASGEHSHAANLWQHFAHLAGAGRVSHVSALLEYVENGTVYDEMCLLNLRTEHGLVGRVAQDVVTVPPRKIARLQGSDGEIQWVGSYDAEGDAILIARGDGPPEVERVPKDRADDFIRELEHIAACLASAEDSSPIGLERGLDTMLVVAAAHLSHREGLTVSIDYDRGYVPDALTAGSRDLAP